MTRRVFLSALAVAPFCPHKSIKTNAIPEILTAEIRYSTSDGEWVEYRALTIRQVEVSFQVPEHMLRGMPRAARRRPVAGSPRG